MLAIAFMSFSPPVRGAEIGVVRPIRARVVADRAWDVLDLGHGRRPHPAPFGERRARNYDDPHHQIEHSCHVHSLIVAVIAVVAALARPWVIALPPPRILEALL